MHEHGPDELMGPLRGTPAWWRGMGAQPEFEQEAPVQEQPRKRRRSANSPAIRTELVQRVRQAIADGTYDTEERWEAALDCLLDRLERD
jgi:Anti-sigma-28 factor, FlgM